MAHVGARRSRDCAGPVEERGALLRRLQSGPGDTSIRHQQCGASDARGMGHQAIRRRGRRVAARAGDAAAAAGARQRWRPRAGLDCRLTSRTDAAGPAGSRCRARKRRRDRSARQQQYSRQHHRRPGGDARQLPHEADGMGRATVQHRPRGGAHRPQDRRAGRHRLPGRRQALARRTAGGPGAGHLQPRALRSRQARRSPAACAQRAAAQRADHVRGAQWRDARADSAVASHRCAIST